MRSEIRLQSQGWKWGEKLETENDDYSFHKIEYKEKIDKFLQLVGYQFGKEKTHIFFVKTERPEFMPLG